MTDRDLDDAIDRAVRDMMAIEPPPRLRGRVTARLERPAQRSLTIPRLAAGLALATAAAFVVVLIAPWTDPAPDVTLTDAGSTSQPAPASGPATTDASTPPKPAATPEDHPAARMRGVERGARTGGGQGVSAPIEEIGPVVVLSIPEPATIETEPIPVVELQVPPLHVDALSVDWTPN